MSDHDFKTALQKAHVDGDGEAVARIWRDIADGEMSDAETLAWAKEVAVWITSTDDLSGTRTPSDKPISEALFPKPDAHISSVERVQAALAVCGLTEPALDNLNDDDDDGHIDYDGHDPDGFGRQLNYLKGSSTFRLEAEKVWRAIASGDADDGTKLEWVEHVASKLVAHLIEDDALDDRLRGLQALNATGLGGAAHPYAGLRDHIKLLADFRELAGLEEVAPAPKQIVKFMRSQGLSEERVNNRKAGKRAERQIAIVMADRPKKLI